MLLTITPEEFGAKADGISNDIVPFRKAISEASAVEGATVLLKKDSVYALYPENEDDFKAVISVKGSYNLTVRGDNTTLVVDAPLYYAEIENTSNFTLEGINFKYKNSPFARAVAYHINFEENYAEVKTDRSLNIAEDYDARSIGSYFGVLDRKHGRWHMFIDGYKIIDIENNIYRIDFTDNGKTIEWMKHLKDTPIIIPMPKLGHCIERAFSICKNLNFTMKNCNIWAVCRFCFALFENDGNIVIENVKIESEPSETIKIACWRDGFHVKENRGKYLWKNCRASGLLDDVFNISASMLEVGKVIAEDDLDLFWAETQGVYAKLMPGDTLSIFNCKTGKDYGRATIKEVVVQEGSSNRVRLDAPIAGIIADESIKVCVDNMVAPNSVIENCDFNGTFRFRGPLTVKNTKFFNLRFWIDISLPHEGPVPRNIHFVDCAFKCDDDNIYFHVRGQEEPVSGVREYHLENIIFENCNFNKNNFEIDPLDSDFVKFI